MPRVSKVGNGHGGDEDYATIALWWAAESGIDYGGLPPEAACLGDCGTNYTISGSALGGLTAIIYTQGFEYDGTSATRDSLATTSRLNLVASDVTIKHMVITNNNNFDNAINLSGLNSLCEFCHINDSSTSSNSYGAIRVDSANNKTIQNCTVEATCAQIFRTGFDDPVTIKNITGWGATSRGLQAAGNTQILIDVFLFDCNNNAFFGAFGTELNSASDDSTSDYNPYGSAELVDFAGGDYRTKVSSFLATNGTNGNQIGAFLETSASTDVTVNELLNIQAIDEVSLTQHNSLSINNLSNLQTVNQVDLTQQNSLLVNNLTNTQSLNQVILTQAHVLTLNSVSMVQSLDQIILTKNNVLPVDDVSQQQTLDQVVLKVTGVLSVDSFFQSQSLDIVTLTEVGVILLSIANVSQNQSITGCELIQHSLISVDNLSQAQLIDTVNFGGIVIGYLQGELSIVYAYNGRTNITNTLTGETKIIENLNGESEIL